MNEINEPGEKSDFHKPKRKSMVSKTKKKQPKKTQVKANDLFACDLCTYQGTTKKYLSKHKRVAHKDPTIKCEFCDKLFHFRSKMLHHMLVHTGEKPFKCDVCGKPFNSQYSLSTHKFIHTNSKPYVCGVGVCEYACRDSSTLRKHRQRHRGELPTYQCQECFHTCNSKRNLKMHVSSKHLGIDLRVHECLRCHKRFEDRTKLSTHIKVVHELSQATTCPLCGVWLSRRCNLDAHMAKHRTDRPYRCTSDGCTRTYKDRSGIRKHLLRHVVARPCPECGRLFARPDRLAKHRTNMHGPPCQRRLPVSKETRHECDMCGFVSRNKPGMAMHIKYYHTYAKKCRVCQKTFTHQWRLQRHCSKVHGIEYECTLGQVNRVKNAKVKAVSGTLDIKSEPADDASIDLFEIEKEESLQDLFYEESESDSLSEETSKRIAESEVSVHINDIPQEVLHGICSEDIAISELDHNHRSTEIVDATVKQSEINTENIHENEAMKDTNNHTKAEQLINVNFDAKYDSETHDSIIHKHVHTDVNSGLESHENIIYKDKDTNSESTTFENINKDINIDQTDPKSLEDTECNTNKCKIANKISDNKEIVYETRVHKKRGPGVTITKEMAKTIIEKHVGRIGAVPDEIFDELFIRHSVRKTKATKNSYRRNDNPTKEGNGDVNDDSHNDDNCNINSSDDKSLESSELKTSDNKITKTKNKRLNNKKISKNRNNGRKVNNNIKKTRQRKSSKPNNASSVNRNDESSHINDEYERIPKSCIDGKDHTSRLEKTSTQDQSWLNKCKIINDLASDKPSRYNTRKLRYDYNEMLNNNESSVDDDDEPLNDKQWIPDEGLEKGDEKNIESGETDTNEARNRKFLFNSHQCFVCFKIYETKDTLIEHCKDHFDICNSITIKKCPLCDYVSSQLPIHMKLVHKIDITRKYNAAQLKDRKDNTKGSRYYVEINHKSFKEIEVIPSVKNLNKIAGMNIDKKNREERDKQISKDRLVKKKEWVVEKEKLNVENVFVPKIDAKETNNDEYMANMRKLYFAAKKEGKVMMFPCKHCEKICQTFAALTLHSRRHDPNKKPFKAKVWKHKLRVLGKNKKQKPVVNEEPETKKTLNNRNEKPKPIVHKHKCAPELKSFYENCIRGGDIEFWQFLKIYNKMGREDVKDFVDLETRKDFAFGLHTPGNSEDVSAAADKVNEDTNKQPMRSSNEDPSSVFISNARRKARTSKTYLKTAPPDRKGGLNKNANKTMKICRFKTSSQDSIRKKVVKLSKQEFLRREKLKESLRKKLANDFN